MIILTVLPNDIDITKIPHVRVVESMDLGSMDLALRAGRFTKMFKNQWIPRATFDTIRFCYLLKAFPQ